MKIVNKTNYSNKDLRRFFIAGCKEYGAVTRRRVIEVVYSRSGFITGYAYYNSLLMRIRLPKDAEYLNKNLKRAAQVFLHELGHNHGLHHREMVKSTTIETHFHEGMQIRTKELALRDTNHKEDQNDTKNPNNQPSGVFLQESGSVQEPSSNLV